MVLYSYIYSYITLVDFVQLLIFKVNTHPSAFKSLYFPGQSPVLKRKLDEFKETHFYTYVLNQPELSCVCVCGGVCEFVCKCV